MLTTGIIVEKVYLPGSSTSKRLPHLLIYVGVWGSMIKHPSPLVNKLSLLDWGHRDLM